MKGPSCAQDFFKRLEETWQLEAHHFVFVFKGLPKLYKLQTP